MFVSVSEQKVTWFRIWGAVTWKCLRQKCSLAFTMVQWQYSAWTLRKQALRLSQCRLCKERVHRFEYDVQEEHNVCWRLSASDIELTDSCFTDTELMLKSYYSQHDKWHSISSHLFLRLLINHFKLNQQRFFFFFYTNNHGSVMFGQYLLFPARVCHDGYWFDFVILFSCSLCFHFSFVRSHYGCVCLPGFVWIYLWTINVLDLYFLRQDPRHSLTVSTGKSKQSQANINI